MRAVMVGVLLGLFVSGLAFAQAGKVEDKKAVSYNEIERGFFFEARGGFWGIINPPTLAGGFTEFSPGQAIGLDMGFDIGERVSPSIFLLATANRMSSQYLGLNTTGAASGDFQSMTPGAATNWVSITRRSVAERVGRAGMQRDRR